jgi:hypothetical protein
MPGPSFLIAHGVPDDALHDRAFALTGKAAPRVAYLGAANEDDPLWFKRIADVVSVRHGARMTFARTIQIDDASEARAAVEGADLIYVAGGDVSIVARRLRELGIDRLIRARHEAGAMILGVSAGAIALTRYWIEFDDDEAKPPSLLECVGALPIAVDCHDEESDWEELRALLSLWGAAHPHERVQALGIPAGGAVELDAQFRATPHGPPPKRLVLDGGAITE